MCLKSGPRLNASGRIEHGKKSVQILISNDEDKSDILGEEIDSFNEIRKTLDRDITMDALYMIENDPELKNMNSTVLYNRDWHKGVVGIVASRVTEQFYRPTIILTESNGMATGSARSVRDFDLYEAIGQCSDLLESYGGHMYAAGLTIKIENIPEFRRRFEEIVTNQLTDSSQMQTIEVDAKITLSEINPRFYRILKQFAPFGPHNLTPVFRTSRMCLMPAQASLLGKNQEHLKLDLVEPDVNSGIFSGIAFGQSDKFDLITSGLPFDVCYSITENEYRGKPVCNSSSATLKKGIFSE